MDDSELDSKERPRSPLHFYRVSEHQNPGANVTALTQWRHSTAAALLRVSWYQIAQLTVVVARLVVRRQVALDVLAVSEVDVAVGTVQLLGLELGVSVWSREEWRVVGISV